MTREEAIRALTIERASHSEGGIVEAAMDMAIDALKYGGPKYVLLSTPPADAQTIDTGIDALREQCVRDVTKTSGETVTNRNGLTNADHIRSMNDEELAELLCTADWCETCDQLKENGTCKAMEQDGPLGKHCVSAGLRWLRQPYKEEP